MRSAPPPQEALNGEHNRQDRCSDDAIQPEVVGCHHHCQRC